jgi:hypothetical protein
MASEPDVYTLLESSFRQASPHLRQSKHLPRRSDEYRTYTRAAAPLRRDYSYATQSTDDSESTAGSQHSTPLASPGALNGAENGLPPTPPTASQDGQSVEEIEPPPRAHADSVVNSLMSKKSSLSTPVNARSPPTPDPSPPRTNGSGSNGTLERPPLFPYPSSRAESFQTAREDLSSSDFEDSRSATPALAVDRLSTVEEDRGLGLGLAFEHDESDATPTNRPGPYFPATEEVDTTAGAIEDKGSPTVEDLPHREWNMDLMRNVTVRRKRRPESISPRKTSSRKESPRKASDPAVTVVETASPTPSNRTRRASSLRERVEASHNSPVTPSIENFAHSIGWPSGGRGVSGESPGNKRLSTISVASTTVSAMVIVTPPRRNPTLRHSGKNMAYRRDSSSPAGFGCETHSNRNSMYSQHEAAPLHRLVHKRTNIADRKNRISVESDTSSHRIMSPSLSLRQRTIDSSAHTLAHQESVRNVLQPAADILSLSGTNARSGGSYHKRVSSAPEATRRATSSKPRNFSELSPPGSPRRREKDMTQAPVLERAPSPTLSPKPYRASPISRKTRKQFRVLPDEKLPADLEKTLPDLPDQGIDGPAERDVFMGASHPVEDERVPSALLDRVRRLISDREPAEGATLVTDSNPNPATLENLSRFSPHLENSPPMRWGSHPSRPYSRDRKRSSPSKGNASLSPDMALRPSLNDRMSSEEMSRPNPEWRKSSGEPGRVSFDTSASRTEEHAMARHLYSQSTPFSQTSQMSDTVEVTEATAVSIYPHNNNSLLVVQQVPRASSMKSEQLQLTAGAHFAPQDSRDLRNTPTPPFVDASEVYEDGDDEEDVEENDEERNDKPQQPNLTFEPSTPPMQIALPQPNGVDSPLKNPRAPPEPPKINFIPPTPMEELEKQLAPAPPGPPERSDSHPQRRVSILQRARRYSDNLITPLLARTSISRTRYNSESNRPTHCNPRVPTVTDSDGTLHPFWRPRGFWDGFDDSESESDDEGGLPQGGDTSDIEDPEPEEEEERPRRANTLRNKVKGGFRGSGGFLIGNSMGLERAGTNKRRHHITLPSQRTASPPKILVQQPTLPLGRHGGGGVKKRRSTNSLRDNVSIEYEQSRRRDRGWREGRALPGLKKYHVQYIGISGVKDRLRERKVEKRREKIRRSIGSRYFVEPVGPGSPSL